MAGRLDFRLNLGRWDRIIRLILGISLVFLALFYPFHTFWVPLIIGLFGLSQLTEGFLGY